MANMWLCVSVLVVATVAAAYLRFGNTAALLGSVASIMLMIRSEGQQPALVPIDDEA
jgi:fatty acid/phospholipid biosynthesis enzyme